MRNDIAGPETESTTAIWEGLEGVGLFPRPARIGVQWSTPIGGGGPLDFYRACTFRFGPPSTAMVVSRC